MKSALVLMGLLTLVTTLTSTVQAAQLPNQTLYIKPQSFERAPTPDVKAFTAYVAYTSDPTNANDQTGPYGAGVQAMTEDVAVTLKGMTLNRIYKCDAHIFDGIRQIQLFQLTNCK